MEMCPKCGQQPMAVEPCGRCGYRNPPEPSHTRPLRARKSVMIGVTGAALCLALVSSLAMYLTLAANSSAPNPTTSTSAAATDNVPTVQCWDNAIELALTDCTIPSRRAGLRYIFPTYESTGSCVSKVHHKGRNLTYQCSTNRNSLVRFGWWRDKAEHRQHYEKKFPNGPCWALRAGTKDIGTICRDRKRVKGIYRMSGYFLGHFSFSIEAKSKGEQDAILGRVLVRDPQNFRGHLVDVELAPLVHVAAS